MGGLRFGSGREGQSPPTLLFASGKYYTVYDWQAQQIGFALAKHMPSEAQLSKLTTSQLLETRVWEGTFMLLHYYQSAVRGMIFSAYFRHQGIHCESKALLRGQIANQFCVIQAPPCM